MCCGFKTKNIKFVNYNLKQKKAWKYDSAKATFYDLNIFIFQYMRYVYVHVTSLYSHDTFYDFHSKQIKCDIV